MTTRTGKIARLPLRLRNRLNFFLMDGKPASLILDWINVEPEAIEVFNNLFGGRPASPQNLSEWRQGGCPSAPNTTPPQTNKNENLTPAPRRVSSPQPERHSNPVPRAGSTTNSPGAAIPSRNEAPASSRAQQTV